MASNRALKRIHKNLQLINNKTEILKTKPQICEIKACLAMLRDEWIEFQTLENSIIDEFTEAQNETANRIETGYLEIKEALYKLEKNYEIERQRESSQIHSESSMIGQNQFLNEMSQLNKRENEVRLPRVNIPSFSGKYSEFPSFKDLFEASIDKNENISSVHKLQYLKGLLKGEAYALINHINITEANYTQAWEKVKERYNKPKHVISTLLKQFMDQPNLHNSSAKDLRNITDVSDEVIRGLQVLGPEAQTRDPWLIYILAKKLDHDSKEAWAHESAAVDFPSLEQFFKFLNNRSDALECLNLSEKVRPISKKVGAMVSQTVIKNECTMCLGEHYITKCDKYLQLSIAERREFASNKKLCFNCLSSKHQAVVCRSKYKFRECRRLHHSTLHSESTSSTKDVDHEDISSNTPSTSKSFNTTVQTKDIKNEQLQTVLPTAVVLIEDNCGNTHRCRALLDSGSQASFISENCIQRLKLPRSKANVSITGITTGTMVSKGKTVINMGSLYNSNLNLEVNALIINHLPTNIPSYNIKAADARILKNFQLADPGFSRCAPIDIIIGADKFFSVMENEKQQFNSTVLQKTVFGWIVSGELNSIKYSGLSTFMALNIQLDINIDKILRLFWEVEELPLAGTLTPEEIECEQYFTNTYQRGLDGQYIVKLPFKTKSEDLGNSQIVSTKRFLALERKLSSDTKLRDEYVKQMREYIELGHMIEVSDSITRKYCDKTSYYLPHHAVTKEESTTTKVRIVFDGSSKTTTGVSLNDKLLVGPTIQPTLWSILLNFRTKKIALVADVEKMYRQVIVAEDDRSYQTILWREKPDDKLKCFQLTRVTFGLACSAYLAIRAMQQLAADTENEDLKHCLLNEFYVDDLLSGTNNVRDAIELKNKLTSLLAKGGFKLRKWRSNVSCFLETKEDEHASDICKNEIATKTLGLQWHPKMDVFTFKIQDESQCAITKRKIISESSRLFDPLGFLSPSIVLLKILFQKLWLLKVDWDDKLPSEYEEEYYRVRNQFEDLKSFKIPRHTNINGEVQIHGFADASEVAYSAVIYSRTITKDGEIVSQLLTAKTKVTPIKRISLPRLELCASYLLAKLMYAVKESLQIDAEYFAWTDSKIVLAWLSTYPARWKTFIANRTSQILDYFPRKHWNYVKSNENPADHGSRGITPKNSVNLKQWWSGPDWLDHEQKNWPVNDESKYTELPNIDMEYSKANQHVVTLNANCESTTNFWLAELFEREFKLQKLFRVVAYVFRFIHFKFTKLYKKDEERSGTQLSSNEIENAKTFCIMWIQRESFNEEIQHILRHKRVSNNSKLLSLAPFIDPNGLLRVSGRLQNADCDYDSKHPIILPQKHILTTRLIWDVHLSNLYAGPTLTTHLIRQNYWIVNGRSKVREITRKCVICKRYAAKTTTQMMGNLPSTRTTLTRPFENCGIDFAGPVHLVARKGRGNNHTTKGYICIFVCLAVKAIHIECVTDMSSEAFLAAMKRFTSRRGIPKNIYTDNGSNFIGAKRILEQACKLIKNINDNYLITEFLSKNSINWHFIPPASPHFGGIWEAAVKSVKGHLLKATRNANLTFEELTTLLCQIENILNSRPLYTTSTDDDFEVLTPAHFLIGTSTGSIPEPYIITPENRLTRWQIIQTRIQGFWKRYHLEYLNNMQQRHKWKTNNESLKINDIVLIKEDNTPACKWPLGRIIEVHAGKDDLIRAVTIKTASSKLQRPIVKLCKLPIC